jgi:hypothetical protein
MSAFTFFVGSTQKSKRREEKKKRVTCAKTNIYLEHTLLDGKEAKMNLIPYPGRYV